MQLVKEQGGTPLPHPNHGKAKMTYFWPRSKHEPQNPPKMPFLGTLGEGICQNCQKYHGKALEQKTDLLGPPNQKRELGGPNTP